MKNLIFTIKQKREQKMHTNSKMDKFTILDFHITL